ncbi:hypothetical protein JB92DRAFT_2083204 [Gautieria morchelliformis]|nr:hypothetical protein JB92DRAFT_2083204 [Gautieria morchelliformis]
MQRNTALGVSGFWVVLGFLRRFGPLTVTCGPSPRISATDNASRSIRSSWMCCGSCSSVRDSESTNPFLSLNIQHRCTDRVSLSAAAMIYDISEA